MVLMLLMMSSLTIMAMMMIRVSYGYDDDTDDDNDHKNDNYTTGCVTRCALGISRLRTWRVFPFPISPAFRCVSLSQHIMFIQPISFFAV